MTTLQPDTAIRLLLRATTARREERFVVLAVRTYFIRIMNASMKKLRAYGLRPVVAPVAAELALNRAATARSFPEFVTRLIDDDRDVADLVIRAIRLYAERFAAMTTEAIEQEVGAIGRDMCAAAQTVSRNLSFISPVNA
ncbi:hypothetical protein [Pusillimonas sp. NJUB218]|uniref:hypothetical protein n=1 Tax=Pusillimonas sp. NJUB218 TaxID=2023230 RepID=UPI000F4B8C3C|nr:hypothetical protein [Pusillimonas sp. NJUB218]ROT43876.1 hypothetical protein CHR62_15280 [Pusillimonas sp. NJUB218]